MPLNLPVALSTLIGSRKLPESVVLPLVGLLLKKAGVGIHPDGVFFLPKGGVEIRATPPSPGYRAPENRGGRPEEIEDVYVIGTLYYEMISGRKLGQLPEREILHGTALDRALDELEELHISSRMLLKAMLSFRPESRVDARLALQELGRLSAEGPSLDDWAVEALFPQKTVPIPRPPARWPWAVGVGCLLLMATAFCALMGGSLLWVTGR